MVITAQLKERTKKMDYRMHQWPGTCDIILTGENIIDAIENDINKGWRSAIAREAKIGNAAGFKLTNVTAEYRKEILGGKGGVEVMIESYGLDLANGEKGKKCEPKSAWIYAEPDDLPEKHVFEINKK
jgi:hypothetical protein